MKTITVSLSNETSINSYPIHIGADLIGQIASILDIKKYSKIFIICDDIIKSHFLEKLQKGLLMQSECIILPSGEKEKNILNIEKVWEALKTGEADRKSLIINLGGGVITDMGGFAASTYMRAIDFINIPTTLLSQVDASVGGKTGIDFSGIKNLIGTFDQPIGVIIDVQTLKTLPQREFISGFAEIIKHGLIADKPYFDKVTQKLPRDFSEEELIDIITASCEIKRKVVEADQKESGLRKVLNFGHTIGHAIEALRLDSNSPLLHGEAISIGMVAEAKISQSMAMISDEDVEIIRQAVIHAGLPVSIEQLDIGEVTSRMHSDKKNENGRINFTLLERIGHATYNQQAPEEVIKEALQFVMK